jgi:hypothetical protein
MGRNNKDFKETALYHGTSHPFEIGDMVTPSILRGEHDDRAWATTDLAEADYFGGGRVYEVAGLGDEEVHPEYPDVRTSKTGFKVTREVPPSEIPQYTEEDVEKKWN